MCEYTSPSLNARQDLLITAVPQLGKEAAIKAIKEWGLSKSKITHLIFQLTKLLERAVSPLGLSDLNSLFWIVHPGGRAILDQVELKLSLNKEKLRASKHVLSEYGNLTSACVLFIINEMRNRSIEDGKRTTGEEQLGRTWAFLPSLQSFILLVGSCGSLERHGFKKINIPISKMTEVLVDRSKAITQQSFQTQDTPSKHLRLRSKFDSFNLVQQNNDWLIHDAFTVTKRRCNIWDL
ncbi:hypothetical protein L1987_47080 [Smallanthus sonchifolius]|uniref:Uncharacterized protein n=1 Tax=Smallanthus sonchifolius TaxID=185202 RepID=A0ACB9G2L3_9ASTR|nr:hypothetical protein L1987_47080 [Smallanthus sonchifolius]